jgi:regulatory protein
VKSELHKKLQKKAVALLARRAYSRWEICEKLLGMAEKSIVDIVLDRLEQLELLNDRDYAYNFALYRVGREGWGPEKIRRALSMRHVSAPDISNALEQIRLLVGDDYALREYLKKYLAKKGMPENKSGVRNLITHLIRRGYNRNSIVSVLKQTLAKGMIRELETGD